MRQLIKFTATDRKDVDHDCRILTLMVVTGKAIDSGDNCITVNNESMTASTVSMHLLDDVDKVVKSLRSLADHIEKEARE